MSKGETHNYMIFNGQTEGWDIDIQFKVVPSVRIYKVCFLSGIS